MFMSGLNVKALLTVSLQDGLAYNLPYKENAQSLPLCLQFSTQFPRSSSEGYIQTILSLLKVHFGTVLCANNLTQC